MRRRDDNKKAAIDAAVMHIVCTAGYANLSMARVAAEAGVSPATLYTYYDGKESMLEGAYAAEIARRSKAFAAGFSEGDSVYYSIHTICRNICDYALKHPTEASFIEQTAKTPLAAGERPGEGMGTDAKVLAAFKKGIDELQLKDMDPRLLLEFCLHAINGVYLNGSAISGKPDFEQVFLMCWDAIKR